jgi:hypothetical protein
LFPKLSHDSTFNLAASRGLASHALILFSLDEILHLPVVLGEVVTAGSSFK